MKQYILGGQVLTPKILIEYCSFGDHVCVIDESTKNIIGNSRQALEFAIAQGETIYGVNTGFGPFCNKKIPADSIHVLQENLILSHCCGMGDPFPPEIVRTIMALRGFSLSKGYSGVRVELIEKLYQLLNHGVIPMIPEQGSVGSSGDLVPLSHMAAALIGEGYCMLDGKKIRTAKILEAAEIMPIVLEAKEGLSLINGTTVQTALAAWVVYELEYLLEMVQVLTALYCEALECNISSYDDRIHEVRNQTGQKLVATNLNFLLRDSKLVNRTISGNDAQEAYTIRCVPQILGACFDTWKHVSEIVTKELNAVTDNPLVFFEDDVIKVISGGNFHGEPMAQVMDMIKVVIGKTCSLLERQMARLIDSDLNKRLPKFLVPTELAGLHSGMMIPQYVAAAIVNENLGLAFPNSVSSLPTSAGHEDINAMGTNSARHALRMVDNLRAIMSLHLLTVMRALCFHETKDISSSLVDIHIQISSDVAIADGKDTFLYDKQEILLQALKKHSWQKVLSQCLRLA